MRSPFMLICTMVFLSALNVGCKSTKSGSSVESSDCFTDDPNDSCPDGIVFKVDGPRSFQFHQYGERWDGWGPAWSGQVGKDNPHQEFLLFGPYLSSPRSAKMVSVRTSIELQGEACNQVDHSCGAGETFPGSEKRMAPTKFRIDLVSKSGSVSHDLQDLSFDGATFARKTIDLKDINIDGPLDGLEVRVYALTPGFVAGETCEPAFRYRGPQTDYKNYQDGEERYVLPWEARGLWNHCVWHTQVEDARLVIHKVTFKGFYGN